MAKLSQKGNFQRRIVERFMEDDALKEFVQSYEEAKFIRSVNFTPADWRLYDQKADIEKLMKHWGISKQSVLRRLGLMHITER